MNVGRFAFVAGFVSVLCLASIDLVDAAPMVGARTLGVPNSTVEVQQVGCNCVHHVRRRRYVHRYEPNDVTPLYPAPPVGLTFRKLFDAGFF